MSTTMKIRIMLLVGSNGKASACVEGFLDWGDHADNIMDWPDGESPSDPDASARYFVEVEVPVPSVTPIVGKAVEA